MVEAYDSASRANSGLGLGIAKNDMVWKHSTHDE